MKSVVKCLFLVSCIANLGINAMEFTENDKMEYGGVRYLALRFSNQDLFGFNEFNNQYSEMTEQSVKALARQILADGTIREKTENSGTIVFPGGCETDISGNFAKVMIKVSKER